jgi:hypothetical protein
MGYTIFWEQHPFTNYTYSNVTKLIPKVVKTKFKIVSGGFVIGDNDDECVVIERVVTQMTYSKTNRLPYTKDAMKALILMVEYGAATDLGHDDANMSWYLEALDEVHAICPLVSYEQQKQYFTVASSPV